MIVYENSKERLNTGFTQEALNEVLEGSVLKELIVQGYNHFEYSFGILYLTTQDKKEKASMQPTEDEILSLIYALGKLTNQVFSPINSQLKISTHFCRAVALDKPISKNLMLYLHIDKHGITK